MPGMCVTPCGGSSGTVSRGVRLDDLQEVVNRVRGGGQLPQDAPEARQRRRDAGEIFAMAIALIEGFIHRMVLAVSSYGVGLVFSGVLRRAAK